MTTIIDLLVFEEGFRDRPYLDSEGYPTVGIGFLLAKTKCTPAELKKYYDFTLPLEAATAWLQAHVSTMQEAMMQESAIRAAWQVCNDPQKAVLLSMSYQLGVKGLVSFRTTLQHVFTRRFTKAAENMLRSKWAEQTPNRAKRHAEQMRTGKWCEEYSK